MTVKFIIFKEPITLKIENIDISHKQNYPL